jgi:hypothetical protein
VTPVIAELAHHPRDGRERAHEDEQRDDGEHVVVEPVVGRRLEEAKRHAPFSRDQVDAEHAGECEGDADVHPDQDQDEDQHGRYGADQDRVHGYSMWPVVVPSSRSM